MDANTGDSTTLNVTIASNGKDPEHEQLWRAVTAGAPPDWDLLLGGYNSCMDWPSAYYWPQLVKVFPQARVILTWRAADS